MKRFLQILVWIVIIAWLHNECENQNKIDREESEKLQIADSISSNDNRERSNTSVQTFVKNENSQVQEEDTSRFDVDEEQLSQDIITINDSIEDSSEQDANVECVRIGAYCNDGTYSNATGSGACSHHGGVSQWDCQ